MERFDVAVAVRVAGFAVALAVGAPAFACAVVLGNEYAAGLMAAALATGWLSMVGMD